MAFNNYPSTPGDIGGKSRCYSERLALAIPINIRRMKSYVDGLVPHGKKQSDHLISYHSHTLFVEISFLPFYCILTRKTSFYKVYITTYLPSIVRS